jgi:hypothetical protein
MDAFRKPLKKPNDLVKLKLTTLHAEITTSRFLNSIKNEIRFLLKKNELKLYGLIPSDSFTHIEIKVRNKTYAVKNVDLLAINFYNEEYVEIVGILNAGELPDIDYTSGEITQQVEIPRIKSEKKNVEMRIASRLDARISGILKATATILGKETNIRIYDISATGLSISMDNKNLSKDVDFLDQLAINIFTTPTESHEINTHICWIKQTPNETKIGLRIIQKNKSENFDSDQGAICLPEDDTLGGVIYKDFLYLETIKFKLLAISAKAMKIKLLSNDIIIYDGQKLDVRFFLHTDSKYVVTTKIKQITQITAHSLEVDLEIENIPKVIETNMVNYIIQNTHASPENIRNAGFNIRYISNAFKFRFVQTHDEYIEVLNLRYLAYKSAGKVDEHSSIKNMIAPLDHKSRILIAYHDTQIIASVALTFPDDVNMVLDTEHALSSGYPSFFPSKTDMIEVSRLCTHPDYRRGDLLHRMFEHIYKINALTKKSLMVTSCDDKLWPIYKKLGFKKCDLSYNHPYLKGIRHHIIYITLGRVNKLKATNGLLTWSYIYGNMHSFLSSWDAINLPFYFRLKSKIGYLLSKILFKKQNSKY